MESDERLKNPCCVEDCNQWTAARPELQCRHSIDGTAAVGRGSGVLPRLWRGSTVCRKAPPPYSDDPTFLAQPRISENLCFLVLPKC